MTIQTASPTLIERFAPAVGLLFLGTAVLLVTDSVAAETRITEDYIAIDVEAEDLDSGDSRWTLTDPSTEQTADDPDPNHSAQAVGQAYLELLPDVRVTHADPAGPPAAYWGNGGQGPDLNYSINFPEAGRYYVHVRALSTGTEDNGIHVGLNGNFPSHGQRMQWCTANLGWKWSSAQRGDEEHPCGVEKTIWLQVPSPGQHTVTFTAREDGFEIDRFILIKDRSSNTRICRPSGENNINCVDGSIAMQDDFVDLAVTLESNRLAGLVDDVFVFTAVAENTDSADTANNATLTFDLDIGTHWEVTQFPGNCQVSGSTVDCDLGSMEPEAVSGNVEIAIHATALSEGDSNVRVSVDSSSLDQVSINNSVATTVSVENRIEFTTLASELTAPDSPIEELEIFSVSSVVKNSGEHRALMPVVLVDFPESLDVRLFPSSCIELIQYKCELADLDPGESKTLTFFLIGERAGLYPVQATVTYVNSETEATELTDFISVKPIQDLPEVDPTADPDEDISNSEVGDSMSGATGTVGLVGLMGLILLRRRRHLAISKAQR